MKRVFVGGTGRSGTTIMSRWLGSHKDLTKIPIESRFIVDSGGLIDVFENLTESYSHDRSRITMRRFLRLMERDLVSRWNAPYVGFDFDQMFAGSYRRALAELRETIVLGEYPGSDFHSSPQTVRQLDALQRRAIRSRPGKVLRWLSGGKLDGSGPREDILVCRKFAPDELAKILARFVDTIFGDLVHSGGTQGWCEDTPANTLHIPFLLKLFPDSRHIHMTRNPYGVVYSYVRQGWAPNDFELAVKLVGEVYKQIVSVLDSLTVSQNRQVMTVKLESLAEPAIQDELCGWIGLDPMEFDESIELRKIETESERSRLSAQEQSLVEEHLGFALDYFGYRDSAASESSGLNNEGTV